MLKRTIGVLPEPKMELLDMEASTNCTAIMASSTQTMSSCIRRACACAIRIKDSNKRTVVLIV